MGMFNNEIKKKGRVIIKKTPAFYLNYRRVATQSGLTQWVKKHGRGFSGDKFQNKHLLLKEVEQFV